MVLSPLRGFWSLDCRYPRAGALGTVLSSLRDLIIATSVTFLCDDESKMVGMIAWRLLPLKMRRSREFRSFGLESNLMMTRARSLIVLAIALVLAVAFVAETQAQERQRSGRGFGRGSSRSSLLGLLSLEQVQKEMKLSEEQMTKVQGIVEMLGAELREQYTAAREIEDRDQQRAKMAELRDQSDEKVREQLGDVVQREQLMRLYQIRMQVRPVVDSLANTYVARRLELTDDQKNKLAEINKSVEAKQSEVYATMRDANDGQRSEAFQKLRKIRSDADAEALELLTAEQKAAFEEMKGEKFELPARRGRQ